MVSPREILVLQRNEAEKNRLNANYFLKCNYSIMEAWGALYFAINNASEPQLDNTKKTLLKELKKQFEAILLPVAKTIFNQRQAEELIQNIYEIIKKNSSSIKKLRKNDYFLLANFLLNLDLQNFLSDPIKGSYDSTSRKVIKAAHITFIKQYTSEKFIEKIDLWFTENIRYLSKEDIKLYSLRYGKLALGLAIASVIFYTYFPRWEWSYLLAGNIISFAVMILIVIFAQNAKSYLDFSKNKAKNALLAVNSPMLLEEDVFWSQIKQISKNIFPLPEAKRELSPDEKKKIKECLEKDWPKYTNYFSTEENKEPELPPRKKADEPRTQLNPQTESLPVTIPAHPVIAQYFDAEKGWQNVTENQRQLFINLIPETAIYIFHMMPPNPYRISGQIMQQFTKLVEDKTIIPRNSKGQSGIKVYNSDIENSDGSVDAVIKIYQEGGWRIGCKVCPLKITTGENESYGMVYVPIMAAPKKDFKASIKNFSTQANKPKTAAENKPGASTPHPKKHQHAKQF